MGLTKSGAHGPELKPPYLQIANPTENPELFPIAWWCLTYQDPSKTGEKEGIYLYFPGQWYLKLLQDIKKNMKTCMGVNPHACGIIDAAIDKDFVSCLGRCLRPIEQEVDGNLKWVADNSGEINSIRTCVGNNDGNGIRVIYNRNQVNSKQALVLIKAVSDKRLIEMAKPL